MYVYIYMYYPANCNFMSTTLENPFMFPFNAKAFVGDLPATPLLPLNGTVYGEARHPWETDSPSAIKEQSDAKRWILSSTKCVKVGF